MQQYILNFFYWWYFIKGEQILVAAVRRLIFLLENTETLPMARNLTVPLFQDNTGMGKMIALVIRSIWVWWGGMFSLVMAVPAFAKALGFLMLPIVAVVGILANLINLLV